MERFDELTPAERSHLAYTANGQAEWFDDPRYNGAWHTHGDDEEPPFQGSLSVTQWNAQRPAQLAAQARWREIAASLAPDQYDANGYLRAPGK